MTIPKRTDPPQIELRSDGWERFERAIDVVAKSPPQHRKAKQKNPKIPGKRQGKKR